MADDSAFLAFGNNSSGIYLDGAVRLHHSEVLGTSRRISHYGLIVASSWLRGTGTISQSDAVCAGNWDSSHTFYADTCP